MKIKSQNTEALFQVRAKLPEGMSAHAMAAYIKTAVQNWKGGMLPDEDPICGLDTDSVKVVVRKKTTVTEYE